MDRGLAVVLSVVGLVGLSIVQACSGNDPHPPVVTEVGFAPINGANGSNSGNGGGGATNIGGDNGGGATNDQTGSGNDGLIGGGVNGAADGGSSTGTGTGTDGGL